MRVSQGIGVLVLLQLLDILSVFIFSMQTKLVLEISIEHLAIPNGIEE